MKQKCEGEPTNVHIKSVFWTTWHYKIIIIILAWKTEFLFNMSIYSTKRLLFFYFHMWQLAPTSIYGYISHLFFSVAFDLCCYYNLIYNSPCTQSHEQQITWLSVRSSMFWQFHWALRRLFFLFPIMKHGVILI